MVQNTNVLIIGAGPAGLTTAKYLADNDIKSIVVEKNSKPGSNNFYSGVIENEILEEIFDKIKDEKIERELTEYRAYLLQNDSFLSLNERKALKKRSIVLHQIFTDWMCEQIKKTGISFLFNTLAEGLIIKDSKICGIKTSKGDLYSDVVIISEGVSSILVKKSGLRKGEISPANIFIYAEETFSLDPELIQERFNISEKEGVSIKLFSDEVLKMPSTGYINTNKNSVTVGIGVLFSELISTGININSCLELIKKHPAVYPLIKSGKTIKYSSFMLPFHSENSPAFSSVKVYENGCLITGGTTLLLDPFSWSISANAILAGKLAAQMLIKAKDLNDYSKNTLQEYKKLLEKNITVSPYKKIQAPEKNNPEEESETINSLSLYFLQGI